MKNNDGMTRLRRKTVRSFLVILFCIGAVDILIELVADKLAASAEENIGFATAASVAMLALNIAVYVLSGYVFFRITKKNIKEESERQTREKDLIYAALAHDLKTPMTSVQGFARALSEDKIKPEEQQEAFDIIYRKSSSMNDMVDTLFEYARLGADDRRPNVGEIDICALVRDVAAENYSDLEEQGIELDVDIPDAAVTISGDKTELRRAVSNLVVNVYKHNPGGIKAKISVTGEDGGAVIRIADSGGELPEGIDIFEPFVTENDARTPGGGTGLGLAVTKCIVERNGGRIYTEAGEDGYTKVFVIRL